MHSHVSVVHNGVASYLRDTSREQCRQIHKEGVLYLGTEGAIDQLKANGTYYRSLTLAGKTGMNGECKGAMYSDYYGTWDDVVVLAQAVISLRTARAPVHLESGKVILSSGTTCALTDGNCLDSNDGYTFWQPFAEDVCKFGRYDVLYEGMATKMRGNEDLQNFTIYSLTSDDVTFALTQTRLRIICGYTLVATEHPKLFIFETKQGNTFKSRTDVPVDNLDIFTYINSKFVYVERHVRTQMQALYHDVLQQRCNLERQVLHNTLSFASILPDEFAYRLMKVPGYMAVVAGEVIHVIKCVPVEVVLRPTNACYTDLPVKLMNASYFVTPKSRLLIKHSTKRECNSLLPAYYCIEETWIQFNPNPTLTLPPQILKPLTKLTWTYLTPSSLAVSGIYSQQDLDNLRNYIMFPSEKSAVLHTIARGFAGHSYHDDEIFLKYLLDKDTLNEIYISTAAKIWSGFVAFGSATAGVFGIFVIVRLVKIIFDTMIHGYALHSAYGCGLQLIGALWSSVTHLLLHLATKTRNKENPKSPVESKNPVQSTVEATNVCGAAHHEQPRRSETLGPIPTVYTYRELQSQIEETNQTPRI